MPQTPDFSPAAKRKIAQAVRKVLNATGAGADVARPAHPRTPPVGAGQYQGMVFQVVAQNTVGWDMLRAHAMEVT